MKVNLLGLDRGSSTPQEGKRLPTLQLGSPLVSGFQDPEVGRLATSLGFRV